MVVTIGFRVKGLGLHVIPPFPTSPTPNFPYIIEVSLSFSNPPLPETEGQASMSGAIEECSRCRDRHDSRLLLRGLI